MKNDINLLHSKTKSPLNSLANKVDILRTIAVFLLFLVAFLSVTFFFLVLVSPLPSLRREENAKRLALRSLYGKITDLYILNDRMKGVSEVLDKRVNYDAIVGGILDNVPSGVTVDALKSIDTDILLDASSTSLLSLQTYVDALVKENTDKKLFSTITQSAFSITPNSNKAQVHIVFTL